MTDLRASVVIVSRDRPAELRKCLLALRHQSFRSFEVIVVSNADGLCVADALSDLIEVKQSRFDQENISAARNVGIANSAATVVAFIDDDAVAEPTWLERLLAPFANPDVAAAGGYVRGRNGISYQWKGEAVGLAGDAEPLELWDTTILEGSEYRAIKTHGTNCAFRRDVLVELGGFDENLRFYLDETDLNFRIAKAGLLTAVVPGAEVQHGFSASPRRTADRAPTSLFEIAASKAYFLVKQGLSSDKLAKFREEQRNRVLRHLVAGTLEPRDITRLMAEVDAGFADGLTRQHKSKTFDRTGDQHAYLPALETNLPPHRFVYGRWRDRKAVFDAAKTAGNATAMIFSRTALYHKRWFHPDGFWVQSGGLFGRSDRSDPIYKRWTTRKRAEREAADLAKTRSGSSDLTRIG